MKFAEHIAREGWVLLRAGSKEPTGISIPTRGSGLTCKDGELRFALGQNGEPRLLLPMGPSDAFGSPIAGALDIRVSNLIEAGQSKRFLDITCMRTELESAFSQIVHHMMGRITGGAGGVDAALSTIEEFKSLLVPSIGGDIPQTRVAGLVGELLVLKRLLDRSNEAWTSWRGPAMDRHDFARSSSALEVKVSLGKGRNTITINGLEQLSEPAGGRLFLQHFQLEVAASAMLSIASLGRAVLEAASRPDEVKALILGVGCADINDPAWNTVAFRLERETLYAVTAGFPRLISTSFPDAKAPLGVSQVTYRVALDHADAFRINAADVGDVEKLFVP